MSEAQDILEALAQRGVTVWVEGSRLRFRAAKGALTDELRGRLGAQKEAVVAAWRQQAAHTVAVHPATHGQRALWFLHQTMPQSASYNVLFSARIRSPVDLPALRHACQALIDRHPALRTTFGIERDGLVQKINGHAELDWRVHDRPQADLTLLQKEVIEHSRVPFDLGQGPLLRIELFSRAADDHVLLIAVHHIAADGWSTFLLLDELRQLYPAESSEGATPKPRPASDVVAFARWQDEMLAGPVGQAHARYWTGALAGEIPVLDLPTDRRRAATFSDAGSSLKIELGAELSAAVRSLAAACGTTPYVVLLAAYQVLLHRYSGQSVVIVGSPTYGRDRPEFSDVVGDFINMIPLKGDFSQDPAFDDFLAGLRRRVLDGIEHQDYPFPLLVEQLQPQRDPSHTPVFQTIFILQKFTQLAGLEAIFSGTSPGTRSDFGGLMLEAFPIPQQEGQIDLALELVELGGVYHGQLKYNTDLFDPGSIVAMGRHYTTLLDAIVKAPQTIISRLPLLQPAEKKSLVNEFNPTNRPYPREATVVTLFEAVSARRPAATALSFHGNGLTYVQLETRVNQLARHLQTLGVGPEKFVALCVERGPDMIVGALGILKAGAAYVPLDPGFPADRLGYMVEDCGAPFLVTQSVLGQSLFPGKTLQRVCLDTDAALIARQAGAAIAPIAGPGNPAYVLYTSGSTGRPKGVVIEHRALTNFLCSMAQAPGLAETDILAAVTTLSFDIAGLEIFLPLITGARIELIDRDTALDGVALGRVLEASKATVMQATPATWRLLFESGWSGNRRLRVLCGGEALSDDLAAQLLSGCAEVWNMYGPTETTIWSSLARITPTSDVTIGRPIANTQMYILDSHREPVPQGVIGELWIGGDGVARNYLNQPELTAGRFVPNPFHPGRMYRTGDQARYQADGNIDCLGRIDAQVKVRGYRIELGEIESVLSEVPDVAECAVVAQANGGDNRLVAYLVGHASADACLQLLRTRLPEYMVPAVFIILPALPKTPNNKIDRKALPAPDRVDPQATLEYVAPATPTETVVAQVLAEVLHLPAVGVNHNFFELGGHSLLATRALVRLREHFKLEIPVKVFFQAPTAQGLSRWLDAAAEKKESSTDPAFSAIEPASPWKCLVAAQPKGSRPPLFLITGYMDADDTLRILSNLIPHLGPDQPLCGLRPRWLDGYSPLYRSVEELTDEYLADLRAFQPVGPYYLLGDCVGGVVAVEMAQKLIAQGDEVALLVLLDTERPRFHSFLLTEIARLWHRGQHIAEVLKQFWRPVHGTRREALADVLQRKLRRARLTNQPITATDHIYEQRMAYQRLLKRHRLKRYAGRIVLILTEDVYRFIWLLGWKGFADGGIEIHRTPGDHETFRAQFSRELGQCLRRCIDQALAQLEAGKAPAHNRTALRVFQNSGP